MLHDLRVEYLREPIGVARPRFGWLVGDRRVLARELGRDPLADDLDREAAEGPALLSPGETAHRVQLRG